eukprot:CAMPEP_0201574316 /NCGR_PEP_ID=MMETSP0190_2-20130828/18748_1 /ASSEMBLY_ACC=CAM_ASM_000263 /TAXON_ID=37353 /ORGANISM="Rosalina sp." /LENGTH=238 /DNA_ID=CAMNT_0048002407 /DNA_START=93 /DNA_END=809 /DNA_ORIENTATION=-
MTEVMIQQPVDVPSMPGMNQSRSLGAQISPSSQPIVMPSKTDKREESIDGNKEETIESNLSKVIAQVTPNNNNNNNNNNGDNPVMVKHATERLHLNIKNKKPELKRIHSAPELKKYDDCREFDSFAGEWIDSKGQTVLISPWGVIRYPNNPKLRFEAIYMGPNHLSVTFDKDPKRRKFVGKLNHECDLLIWSNDTKWARKGSKHDPRFQPVNGKNGKKSSNDNKGKPNHKNNGSCLIQ